MSISVTIATKNESTNIEKCIESIHFAEEIVVIDDCSIDDTAEKSRKLGARVLVRDSGGSFHENKNVAIEQAKCDWILSLDADEIVSSELADSIQSALSNPICDGYLIDRRTYFLGRWIRGCGWYPDHNLRLFRKGKVWWPLEIHKPTKLEGGNKNVIVLNGPLIHYSYNNFEQYFDKFNRYTSRLAVEYALHNVKMEGINIPINLFLRPLYWFLKKYIVLHGYRDGLLGFFICFSSALTIFISHFKLWHSNNCKHNMSIGNEGKK